MLTRLRKTFALALLLGLSAFSGGLKASGQATILSISFANGDPAMHIGSVITVNMSVIDASVQLSGVSVTSALAGVLNLGSSDLASQLGGATLYITDGTRTWYYNYPGGGVTNFSVSNGALLNPNTPGWVVSDYTTLQNQTFRVYMGTLLQGPVPGAPTVTADLGTFGTVVLNDGGANPDLGADGVWSAAYTVPDLTATYSGVRLYGHAQYNGSPASNDNFQSPGSFSLDALRPVITSVKFSVPTLPSYNNVLYLSANSQGNSTPDPTNTQGRFDLTVNKVNTVVDIDIVSSPVKHLASVVVPNGAATLNGWRVWDGSDGNATPQFVADGVYPVNLYVHDGNGVTGLTFTTQVRVVSMRFELQNIRLSPGGRTVNPTFSAGLITHLNANIVAYRDNAGSLAGSFQALGWPAILAGSPGVATPYGSFYVQGGVYALNETSFLNPDGSLSFGINPIAQHDSNAGADYDGDSLSAEGYAVRYGGDNYQFPIGMCGDSVNGNDWDPVVLPELRVQSGTLADPTRMSAPYSVDILGASPLQGDYRLRLRSRLTGLTWGIPIGAPACLNGGWTIHFSPSSNPDMSSYSGVPGGGQGVFVEDSSLVFSVVSSSVTVADTTPPVFLTSNPLAASTSGPNVYGGSGAQLFAKFQDNESGMDISSKSEIATVTDPFGNFVPGVSSSDGGGPNNTITVYFTPNASLKVGGAYTFNVHTCNTAGLCLDKSIKFNVLDTTAPSVSAVELVPQVGLTTIPLSPDQSGPEGPFQGISQVWVTLSIPQTSNNSIDWVDSNVSLYQVVNGTKVPVNMTRLTVGTPSDGKLKYRLNTVINTAGLFEVDTQTFSLDASSGTFSGPPAGTINPQFTTVVCLSCITTLYAPPGNDPSRPAITAQYPLTVSAGVVSVNPSTLGVDAPSDSLLPSDPGWTMLTSTLDAQSMRFYVGGVLQLTPLTWTYGSQVPVTFKMYYNAADLPSGVKQTDLQVRAYSNGAWSTLSSNVVQDSLSNTGDSFAFGPTSSQQAALYYAIRYPAIAGSVNTGGGSTPTPMVFKSTRSFNPNATNALSQKARFFYDTKVAADLEARVFDTQGRLIRLMSVGNGGINLALAPITDTQYGKSEYYFTWDGANDNGNVVRNGVYLVRWQLTRSDGTSDTQTKLVAMIK